jgi:integrase
MPERNFLRPEENQELLLKHADEPYRTLFMTTVLTGMRRGELLALQWGDIDWHNNVIRVRRSVFWHTRKELAELQLAPTDGHVRGWRFSTPKIQTLRSDDQPLAAARPRLDSDDPRSVRSLACRRRSNSSGSNWISWCSVPISSPIRNHKMW